MGHRQTPWRADMTILTRLEQVQRRHLAGESNVAIAAALGVDEGTIRNDVRRLVALWVERLGQDAEALRAEVVARLDDVLHRAIQAAEWDQACEQAVLFGTPVTLSGEGAGAGGRHVLRDANGGARFSGNKAAALSVARQAIMDKAKVLGLIIEQRADVSATPLVRVYQRTIVLGEDGEIAEDRWREGVGPAAEGGADAGDA